MFFCEAAYSEKKNSVYTEESDRGENFYNNSYEKRAAGSNRDIISYNRIDRDDDYEKFSGTKVKTGNSLKKDSDKNRITDNKKNSVKEQADETVCYVVKNGDTLFGIAKRSNMPLKKLLDYNDLGENTKIYKGMKLKIPSRNESRKISKNPSEKVYVSSKPLFLWPLKKVKGYSRDGEDGVKSIGLIIKGNPGSEVIASENGIVKRVGYMRGYGKYIVVKHGKSYITVYSNLMDVNVKAGDTVQKGGRIGNISDDMTLHFQIDREGKPENPLTLLPGRG